MAVPSQIIEIPHAFLVSTSVAAAVNLVWPILFAVWARRRFNLRWAWIGIGALGFVLSQLVHLPLSLVARHFWLGSRLTALFAFASITAGLCEETARWILLRRAIPDRTFRGGLGYGIGHGGAESVLLLGIGGIATVIGVIAIAKLDLSTLPLSPDKLEAVRQQKDAIAKMILAGSLTPLLEIWERVCAVALHIALSLCVLRTVVRKNPGWWILAVIAHGAVDFIAALVNQRGGALPVEGFLTLIGLLSLAFIVYEWRRWRRAELAAAVT